jgi:hypothetical protein
VLSSKIVTRGTARFGLPQPISIAPSALKAKVSLINTLPLRGTPIRDGSLILSASGRPVFVLQGDIPAYRDLVPGTSGNDVRQLEQGLERLRFNPGPIDGVFDAETSSAVARWYESAGCEAFGPTAEQLANIRMLEASLSEATKSKLAATAAAASAELAVQAARATAEHKSQVAAAEVEAKTGAQNRILADAAVGEPLAYQVAVATAAHAERVARADIAAKIADRALISLDPRSTLTTRNAADEQLDVARSALVTAKLQGQLSIRNAERDAKFALERDAKVAAEQLELALAAQKAAQLEGQLAVQAALNAQKLAEFDAMLTADRAARIAADLEIANHKTGVQVPVDEILFIPALPARVDEVNVLVGAPASGPVMTITDNQLAIDSALPLDAAPLVQPGMEVIIDEQALGIKARGVVHAVANTPGTRGVDGYHMYCEIRVVETPTPLQGFSLRLTIPTKSTRRVVTVVPISAVSLAADGKSRIQAKDHGALKTILVEPGLSADGFVEVTPLDARLEPGQLVVVGYKTIDSQETP